MPGKRLMRRDFVGDDGMPPGTGRENTGGITVLSGEAYDGNTAHD
jgi:hypothetical protein